MNIVYNLISETPVLVTVLGGLIFINLILSIAKAAIDLWEKFLRKKK